MSECLTPAELAVHAENRLEPGRAAAARAHIALCANCRSSYEQLCDQSDQTIAAPTRPAVALAPAAVRAGPADDGSFVPTPPPAPKGNEPSAHYPRIEGYRILSVLGQGGMGIVYRAVQAKLNRTVALKVLPAIMGAGNPSAVARFRREATAAARLHHTNIIAIHDFGESRDAYYYAMDLIVGWPLNVLIRRMASANAPSLTPTQLSQVLRDGAAEVTPTMVTDPSDPSVNDDSPTTFGSTPTGRGRAYYRHVAQWMADAADALHYAHSQGIIHRDIKPANLILSSEGRIMVADFGLAKTVDEQSMTMTGALVGSLRYVSPEQAMARRVPLDHRTDIYSLGATMYELLCFQPAFPGTDEKQILGAIISRDPTATRKIVPAVPPELETICLKALEKSPDARYATGRAMADDLRRFINDLPIAAKRPGPLRRMGKFVRRHKAPVAAVTAAVLLVLSVLVSIRLNQARQQEGVRKRTAQIAALFESGTNYTLLKKWADAERELMSAVRLDPLNVDTFLTLAWSRLEHYKADPEGAGEATLVSAEEAARHVVELAPSDQKKLVRALGFQAVALRRLKRYEEAVPVFQRCLELEPSMYHNWSNLGTCYACIGDWANAEKYLREGVKRAGVEKDVWHAVAIRNLAEFEFFRKDRACVARAAAALECSPEFLPTWLLRARIALELEGHIDPQTALDDAKYADRIGVFKDPRAKRVLAHAHLRNGEYEAAVREAKTALTLGDLPAINHLIVALAEAQRRNPPAAQAAFANATATWPPELSAPSGFIASAETSDLWIESGERWLALRAEAEKAVAGPAGP